MPKIALKKNRPKQHWVQWVREKLGLSQRQLAELIGASIYTVQSVETARLPLGARYADRLSAATGIPAAWFRENKLRAPLPDAAAMREHFEHFDEAQQGVSAEGAYLAALLPRMFINHLAWLADAVADKLGGDYTSCRRAGFIDALGTAGMKILATIADPEERAEVYEAYRADIKAGDVDLIGRFAAKNREIQSVLRKEERKAAAAGGPQAPAAGALFSAWARAAGIPPAKEARSVAWRWRTKASGETVTNPKSPGAS